LYDLDGNLVRQWYSKAKYQAASPETNYGNSKANSHVIKKTYDKRGRLIAEIDPGKGETRYEYTPFGEVARVKTPRAIAGKIAAQTFEYDVLGRQIRTTNDDGSACYFYDEASAGQSVGQLTETRYYRGVAQSCAVGAKADNYSAQQRYRFDSKGRLLDHDQYILGAGNFDATYGYGSTGQPLSKSWTGGNGGNLTISYRYDSYSGLLKTVQDAGKTHWELTDLDALGNAKGVTLGGITKVVKNYNESTGNMTKVSVTNRAGQSVSSIDYQYNKAGFLTRMSESAYLNGNSYSESYHYDDMAKRQLTSVDTQVGGAAQLNAYVYKYDSLGNIRYSKQMKDYKYDDTSAPHRVTAVNGKDYKYGNTDGNVTSDGRRSLIYGHNHLPTSISQGSGASLRKTNYLYSADDSLLYRKDQEGSAVTQENWYFGDMQLTKKGASTEKVYSLAEGVTLVIDVGGSARKEAQYSVTNNIGSTHIVLDQNGNTKQRILYDPFGKPTQFFNASTASTIQDWSGFATKDGFTGHEHLYELDLIHMQGRVYDPTIGRFLQADLVVQAPGQILSYNRYAYVWNNPGAYTDPSGYEVLGLDGEGNPIIEEASNYSSIESYAASGELNGKANNTNNLTAYADVLVRAADDYLGGNVMAVSSHLSAEVVSHGLKLDAEYRAQHPEISGQVNAWDPILVFAGMGLRSIVSGGMRFFTARFAGGNGVVKGLGQPTVIDSKLRNLVNDLYKGASTKKPIGTGSTADAIRWEAKTGQPVGGRFHIGKGQQYVNALRSWLRKNPNASPSDRSAAQSMLDDLNNAIGG